MTKGMITKVELELLLLENGKGSLLSNSDVYNLCKTAI